jgi:hypothetical protein
VGQTLGKIVRLLVEARKEGTDRLLVSFGHSTTMARGPSTSKRGRAIETHAASSGQHAVDGSATLSGGDVPPRGRAHACPLLSPVHTGEDA